MQRMTHSTNPRRSAPTLAMSLASVLLTLSMAMPDVAQAGLPAADKPGEKPVSFNRDIRPILADICFHCHGPDPASRKASLRLDREDGFFGARKNGPIVVPGKPEQSALYLRLVSDDADEIMPPPKSHKTLTPEEKDRVKRWIAQGAKWEPHWSFIKPQRPELPAVKNAAWVKNPIDRFVLAKLEAKGLAPAPEADRRALARRAALDATGLPPEPALVEAFVNDPSPNAYEKLVDQLLASPKYGEHQARFWLDAARYGDTHGLHYDNYREMWPYRDWVVNAYNRNLPFDQFTIDQIAGDLLPNATPEQKVATGFHRCNITTNEGGSIADEVLVGYARDRVETTGWVWLGLTTNCCVCHDHKFDPLTQRDFYSMSAYFRNTTQGAMDGNVRDTPPNMRMPTAQDQVRMDAIPGQIDAATKAMAARKAEIRKEFEQWLATAKPEDAERLGSVAGMSVHVPLNEGQGDEVEIAVGDAKKKVKASAALEWRKDAVQGPGPVLAKGAQVELGDLANFDQTEDYAVAAWILQPAANVGGAVVARMDPGPGFRGWDLYVQGDKLASHLIHDWDKKNAIKAVTKNPVLKPGKWHHVAVVYDAPAADAKQPKRGKRIPGLKLYVDGVEQPLTFEANGLKGSTKSNAKTPLRIGRREQDSAFAGGVQDVRIYNRNLAPAEVKGLAQAAKLKDFLAKEPKDRNPKVKDELFDAYAAGDDKVAEAVEQLSAVEAEKAAILARSPLTLVMQEKPGMGMANILFRGEYTKPKDKVEPNVFSALHPVPSDAPKNRLGLAQWLTSKENALTPRVVVNRHWQAVFGTGIVKTSEDFGIMGDAPSHPELLDWLAVEFRDGGWDVKALIRLMLTSAAYRQSAVVDSLKLEKDRDNRLLCRGPRFRMDAEMIRDYALAASGLLSAKMGGPSVKPYQPPGVWDVVGMPGSDTRNYKQDTGEDLYRRGVYTFWKRAAPPASLEVLNAPNREVSCVRRERTNTPLQALVTLNDPQFVESARALAQKALLDGAGQAKPAAATLAFIAQRVLQRPLTPPESAVVLAMQADLLAQYKAAPQAAKALLAVGDSKPDPVLDPVLLAAWTMTCNQMLNLDEALNK